MLHGSVVDLALPLRFTPPIVLRSRLSDSAAGFDRLARLLGVEPGSPEPAAEPAFTVQTRESSRSGWVPIFEEPGTAIGWDREWQAFLIAAAEQHSAAGDLALIRLWQRAVLFGISAAMLRGYRVIPVHGAWLSTRRGALLLCGESGVGKSTSARRWQADGGEAPADDLILLEYGAEGAYVRALPTWSACQLSLSGRCFPVTREEPLIGVLALGRGEQREEILPVSGAEFFAQLYRSSFFHVLSIARHLPEPERGRLIQAVQAGAGFLAAQFPPRALFARLDGALRETLKEYDDESEPLCRHAGTV